VRAASDGDVIVLLPGVHPSGGDDASTGGGGGVVVDKRVLVVGGGTEPSQVGGPAGGQGAGVWPGGSLPAPKVLVQCKSNPPSLSALSFCTPLAISCFISCSCCWSHTFLG
jgi:hypothetical protein